MGVCALSWQCQQYGAGNILTHPHSGIYHSMWSKRNGSETACVAVACLAKEALSSDTVTAYRLRGVDSERTQGTPLATLQAKNHPCVREMSAWPVFVTLQGRQFSNPLGQRQCKPTPSLLA